MPRTMRAASSVASINGLSGGSNRAGAAIVGIGIAMAVIDDYVIDVLMRDLVGHDRKPAGFLVYLWLAAEQARRHAEVRVSYEEMAESIGISRSSAQSAVRWLLKRRLLSVKKQTVTATPIYTVRRPWRRDDPSSPSAHQ